MKLKRCLVVVAFLILPMQLFANEVVVRNVFFDGVFDIPHYAHQQAIQNAKQTAMKHFGLPAAQIHVIIGVSGTDSELASYKRPSVYTIQEKMQQMSGFKDVDKVVNSPMVMTADFIKEHHIDLVVAGNDYNDIDKIRKYYKVPYEMGIFKTFPRSNGISTSALMKRVVKVVAVKVTDSIQSQQPKEMSQDLQTIDRFLALAEQYF